MCSENRIVKCGFQPLPRNSSHKCIIRKSLNDYCIFDILCNHKGGTLLKHLYGGFFKVNGTRVIKSQKL